MAAASFKHRLIVGAAGAPAAAILNSGGRFETLAVFERSFYVKDRHDRLICFVRDDLEPGPLNLLCAGWPEDSGSLPPEKNVWVLNNGALSSPNVDIILTGKRLWQPEPCPIPKPESVAAGLQTLKELIRRHSPGDSVATLLFTGPFVSSSGGLRGTMLVAAAKGVAELSAWLADEVSCADPCFLLGLGGGLTPAGDDVLGGTLLGLHALGLIRLAERLALMVRNAAGFKTNRISQAHLEAACDGLGVAVLHDCLAAALAGGKGLSKILPRLTKVGHTSGWDAVLGMMVALRHYISTSVT